MTDTVRDELMDADYIKREERWTNKQRVLVFSSKGSSPCYKHLMEDFKAMMPHSKSEPKFDKNLDMSEIGEICEMRSCNNAVYFEHHKSKYCYVYFAGMPIGPTIKFQVYNVHTLNELKLSGNALKGSRPLLHFDSAFTDHSMPHLTLMKSMFQRVFGVPRNHPKSKPFHDHIMGFYWIDNKVWVRHYQISPTTPDYLDNPDYQTLTEIGPRFVLEPVLILNGSFSGQVIYKNTEFKSPAQIMRGMRLAKGEAAMQATIQGEKGRERKTDAEIEPDHLDDMFDDEESNYSD
jgi:ribosome biogenesis protein BRX1